MGAMVLVVEDERRLRDLLRSYLERASYTVLTAGTGVDGLHLLATALPDLVVLDLRLPDIAGEEVAVEIRDRSEAGLIMLTAKATQDDRIRGFELGADDYLTKPFSPRELVLRVQAILRRGRTVGADGPSSFGHGELKVDAARREVTVRGHRLQLTPTEWGVITALARSPGRVYSRAELINQVRGYEVDVYERTIDSHVRNLRRKLERDHRHPEVVVTVLGGGYRLALEPDD